MECIDFLPTKSTKNHEGPLFRRKNLVIFVPFVGDIFIFYETFGVNASRMQLIYCHYRVGSVFLWKLTYPNYAPIEY